jgi:multidrug efflux pump subunit AcrA (membrane-fusion protein)
VELVGKADPRRRSTLGAETAGRVERMRADEGDYVLAGDVVCEMRKRPVQIQLDRAKARLAASKAELAKLEGGYRSEEIRQAEARLKSAQAGLRRWKLEYERTRRLLAEGASTPAEMDRAEAAYEQAREAVAEAEANLELRRTGFRAEDIDRARSEVAAQSATVDELSDTLDRMTIRMPFNGFVVHKHCDDGQWLNPGSPVVDVVDLDVVRVRVDVPERYATGVRVGYKAPVVFENIGNGEFEGTVSQVVPLSAEATHTLTVRVDVKNRIDDDRAAIPAGLYARVWLPVGKEHEALLVPKDALIRREGQDRVYTVSNKPPPGTEEEEKPGEGKPASDGPPVKYAVAIPVKIVGGYGRFMEVESEQLEAGTPLVTRGTYLLSPGAAVVERPKERGDRPADADRTATSE